MKFALISDIHGNVDALSAVIADARENGAEQFVFAGDYIFDLPFSNETVEQIRALDALLVIQGNKEGYLPGLSDQSNPEWDLDQFGVLCQTYRDLKQDNLHYLMELPQEGIVELPIHGRMHVLHQIPELFGKEKLAISHSSKYGRAYRQLPFSHEEFLREVAIGLNCVSTREKIAAFGANVVVLGHSHLQWYGRSGDTLVINPGSCGQPLDCDLRASYTLLEDTTGGLRVEERRVIYDWESAIQRAKQTECYRRGKIWSELIFVALKTGIDYFSEFFELASRIALERGEQPRMFNNEVWNLTAKRYWNTES